jgi:hypothetical protein
VQKEAGRHGAGGAQRLGRALAGPARLPGDERRAGFVPSLDDGIARAGDAQAFAGLDDVVVEFALARHPDAAGDHVELPAAGAEGERLAGDKRPGRAAGEAGEVSELVRIHHV